MRGGVPPRSVGGRIVRADSVRASECMEPYSMELGDGRETETVRWCWGADADALRVRNSGETTDEYVERVAEEGLTGDVMLRCC